MSVWDLLRNISSSMISRRIVFIILVVLLVQIGLAVKIGVAVLHAGRRLLYLAGG